MLHDLYVYDEVAGVPGDARILDAAEILPASRIFRYREGGSYSGFANFFRYKLLLERGGWWVDTDVICVKPFELDDELVFASERAGGEVAVTSSVIRAPATSAVMAYCWDACRGSEPRDLVWGETGPALLGRAVRESSLQSHVRAPEVFCPLRYDQWHRFLEPDHGSALAEETHAVHLWHERWRAAAVDKNADYPAGCLYEVLKDRYL